VDCIRFSVFCLTSCVYRVTNNAIDVEGRHTSSTPEREARRNGPANRSLPSRRLALYLNRTYEQVTTPYQHTSIPEYRHVFTCTLSNYTDYRSVNSEDDTPPRWRWSQCRLNPMWSWDSDSMPNTSN
jgi:hypothetical protein